MMGKHYREDMNDDTSKRPGLISRLFGGAAEVRAEAPKPSWWQRLKSGLARSSASIGQGITDLFTKRKLDAATLEEFEDVLIRADLGLAVSTRIVEAVGKGRYGKEISGDEVKAILAEEVTKSLVPVARPLTIDRMKKPFILLMVGVNGAGKTTLLKLLTGRISNTALPVHVMQVVDGDLVNPDANLFWQNCLDAEPFLISTTHARHVLGLHLLRQLHLLQLPEDERAELLQRVKKSLPPLASECIVDDADGLEKRLLQEILAVCRPDTMLCVAAGLTTPEQTIQALPVSKWKGLNVTLPKLPALFLLGH